MNKEDRAYIVNGVLTKVMQSLHIIYREMEKISTEVHHFSYVEPLNTILLDKLNKHFYFSIRVCNVFEKNNIVFVADLVTLSENELLRLRGLGRKSINEIKEQLYECEVQLGIGMKLDPKILEVLKELKTRNNATMK